MLRMLHKAVASGTLSRRPIEPRIADAKDRAFGPSVFGSFPIGPRPGTRPRIWHSPQTRRKAAKPASLRPARALCDDPRGRFLGAEARASHAPDSPDCPIAMMPANWRVDALPSPASLFAGRPVSTGGREAHGF